MALFGQASFTTLFYLETCWLFLKYFPSLYCLWWVGCHTLLRLHVLQAKAWTPLFPQCILFFSTQICSSCKAPEVTAVTIQGLSGVTLTGFGAHREFAPLQWCCSHIPGSEIPYGPGITDTRALRSWNSSGGEKGSQYLNLCLNVLVIIVYTSSPALPHVLCL